eukprot:scaffold14180_cov72-Skeletonema_dohrnii-CCMP3373.AAC.1
MESEEEDAGWIGANASSSPLWVAATFTITYLRHLYHLLESIGLSIGLESCNSSELFRAGSPGTHACHEEGITRCGVREGAAGRDLSAFGVAERIRETKLLSEIADADADRHILCPSELTSARSV